MLRDNKWGFDLSLDNPFWIFPLLRKIAIESVGEEQVVDLSRGDPGYGFCPSVKGREFYAFLLQIDNVLNNTQTLLVSDNRDDFETLRKKIEEMANSVYQKAKAEEFMAAFDYFLEVIGKSVNGQGLHWDKRRIVFEIFKYSAVSGGSYLLPSGEILVKAVVADNYNKKLQSDVNYEDIILLQGVAQGIATIFAFLCDENIEFLKRGDNVLIASPVYVPYNTIMHNRGLNTYSIPIDPTTGLVSGDIDDILAKAPENLKLICLIDPNNPTGFMNDEAFLQKIAEFAEKRDALIVSDEVYSDFFVNRKKSIMSFARKRSIILGGRSKIERSTGLRFGEYIISKEAQEYIWKNLLKEKAFASKNLMQALVFAKSPGSVRGEFQHVTFVPGPSQFLGISHMIFGEEDRQEYLKRVSMNMRSFYEILGLPYVGNLYYGCFDLLKIPGCKKEGIDPHDIFIDLAKLGVVLLPANLFFSEEMRAEKDYRSFARASVPNVSPNHLTRAAEIIKKYLRTC